MSEITTPPDVKDSTNEQAKFTPIRRNHVARLQELARRAQEQKNDGTPSEVVLRDLAKGDQLDPVKKTDKGINSLSRTEEGTELLQSINAEEDPDKKSYGIRTAAAVRLLRDKDAI